MQPLLTNVLSLCSLVLYCFMVLYEPHEFDYTAQSGENEGARGLIDHNTKINITASREFSRPTKSGHVVDDFHNLSQHFPSMLSF